VEVDISRNFLLIVTQPGEGFCNVATQSNSPRYNQSIDQPSKQAIIFLS
jgi:hypothetical protein